MNKLYEELDHCYSNLLSWRHLGFSPGYMVTMRSPFGPIRISSDRCETPTRLVKQGRPPAFLFSTDRKLIEVTTLSFRIVPLVYRMQENFNIFSMFLV